MVQSKKHNETRGGGPGGGSELEMLSVKVPHTTGQHGDSISHDNWPSMVALRLRRQDVERSAWHALRVGRVGSLALLGEKVLSCVCEMAAQLVMQTTDTLVTVFVELLVQQFIFRSASSTSWRVFGRGSQTWNFKESPYGRQLCCTSLNQHLLLSQLLSATCLS